MGLEIKQYKNGKYQIRSSISDELIHKEKSVSLEEAKKALMKRLFFRFMNDAIQIDMDFPLGYIVNGQYVRYGNTSYYGWIVDPEKGRNDEVYDAKMKEILKKIGITE